jgi:hypothetical protein
MNKIIIIFVSFAFAVNTSALDFVGQPNADVNHPHFNIGLNYSFSENDLDFDHSDTGIDNFTVNKYGAEMQLSVTDDLELILRIGSADAKFNKSDNREYTYGYFGKSGETFLIGGGVKATIYKNDYMKWGFSAFVSGGKFSWDDVDEFRIEDANFYDVQAEAPYLDAMIFTGPNFKINNNINLYFGPFWHIISGKVESEGVAEFPSGVFTDYKISNNFRQDSLLGIIAGTQINLDKNLGFNFEWQKTNSAEGFAGGMVLKF